MLQALHVKNFAIIDTLTLELGDGLTVLSGETGAGKSIIVGALGLLMGGRASSEMIRTDKNEAVVEAVFDLAGYTDIRDQLVQLGLDQADDQLVIRRTISKNGKNKIYIGERLANMQMLSAIGGRLIDISGQYSQQILLQNEYHREIVDTYCGLKDELDEYRQLYAGYHEKLAELQELMGREKDKQNRRELLAFQLDEIQKADLEPGEEAQLKDERRLLMHARKRYEAAYGSYEQVYGHENSCLGTLGSSLKLLDQVADIDKQLQPLRDSLESVIINLEDVAFSLRDYAEKITMDPDRINEVEERLDVIQRLTRKYGKKVEEIIVLSDTIELELKTIECSSLRIEHIGKDLTQLSRKLWDLADQISRARMAAGRALKKSVEAELTSIGMKKAVFKVQVVSAEQIVGNEPAEAVSGLNPYGMDTIEFFIAANKGEAPKPLSKVASGGELSRIVLALKKILAAGYRVPTLLFDEVDAGIGGAVADAVGAKIKEIAGIHQVICITHLAQIACFGKQHFSVMKAERGGRTMTSVKLLDDVERIEEISRMVGGKSISDSTRAHASEMLNNAAAN
ncbi:MAG: DNA repair protein RecN [Deltaproteobacteria bacterium]|nr:DNA repair protein RecN [Deltaproteobacteria bacterium]